MPELPSPITKQSETFGHEIPTYKLVTFGTVWLFHVTPPSTVASTYPVTPILLVPTAKQSDTDGHATALSESTPDEAVDVVQVFPPSMLLRMMPLEYWL